MKCRNCGEVNEITEICTSYTTELHSPRAIGKLIFQKLIQCPNCKTVGLLELCSSLSESRSEKP